MNNPLYENHSSKIKRVFIALKNYSFYHGPSEMGDSDERFIGRKRLLEKFKSVLKNTSRKSGIYLVTGYRGMGKTSFVNKAIEEIFSPSRFFIGMKRCGFLLLISCFLSLLLLVIFSGINQNFIWSLRALWAPYLQISLFTFLIYWGITKYPKLLLRRLWLQKSENHDRKHIKYFEEIILITFYSSLTLFLLSLFFKETKYCNYNIYNLTYWTRKIISGFIYAFIFLNILSYILWKRYYKRNITPNINDPLISKLFNPIRKFLNHSSTVIINLNLGYSDLKEINILKLIARNIKTGFEGHKRIFSINKLVKLLSILIIIIIVCIIYNLDSLKRFNNSIKSTIGINTLFPSQTSIFMKSNTTDLKTVVDYLHDNNKMTSENYFIYIHTIINNSVNSENLYNSLIYLNHFDKNLINFLDIGKLQDLNIDSFEIEFQRKKDGFFKLLNLYRLNKGANIGVDDILIIKKFLNLSPKELIDLVSFFKENKDIKLSSNDITTDFLYQLYKLNNLHVQYNSFNIFEKKLISLTNYIDYFLYIGYYHFRNIIPLRNINTTNYKLIPSQIDYLYLIYIMLFITLFKLVQNLIYFNRPNLIKVSKKINFINDLIDSSLSTETGSNLTLYKDSFSFTKKKNQTYSIADEREIEKNIIEIINDISLLPFSSYRSEFLFIFDELDKIEPNYKSENKSDSKTQIYSPEGIRKRQQAIMVLLSNLKYFLSTAKSKFIFIAGREMFDASLADVSDRNFRIGSIFHDTFYLPSFYSDLTEYAFEDITSRTEQYVCQFLLPLNKKFKTLKSYNDYLIETYPDEFNDKQNSRDNYSAIIAKQKREKIIYLLQHFIVYLNHQSAGSPSKITSYFENYVVSKDMFKEISKKDWYEYSLFVGDPTSEDLFLFFDYFDQYELGFINYLITPFNYSINKVIKNYGDKLIVSASYLHNHIFKFHRNAFSWRDLEATPEMVDINKNPELRDFLSRLIEYMLQTHIQEVINGIYDFKFPKKISQELLYLSHISEEASASFNFTLDESLTIKEHYRDQLLKFINNKKHEISDEDDYLYSVSSINLTLADICFYDGDYGEAILYYLEAMQQIRNKPIDSLSLTQFMLLTRNMLKLGYALEKRKTYDSAHLTYCEITDIILNMIQHIISVDKKNHVDFMKAILNNINYLYQPLLGKLHLIEKTSSDGLKKSDLERIYREFDLLKNVFEAIDASEQLYLKIEKNNGKVKIDNGDKYLIQSEFWNKIGNLLYYKNSCLEDQIICPFKDEEKCKFRPCSACKKYIDSLNMILIKHGIKLEKYLEDYYIYDDVADFINAIRMLIKEHNNLNIKNSEYRLLAILLANYGNINLSCSKNDFLDVKFINEINKYFEGKIDLNEIVFEEKINKLGVIIFSYLCSSYFYRVSNDHKSASFQYNCILNFLYEYTLINQIRLDETIREKLGILVKNIASRAIKDIYCSYDFIHNYEISKYKNIFDTEKKLLVTEDISLKRVSINNDLDEINTITQKINLTLFPHIDLRDTDMFNIYNLVSPYCMNTNMFNRIIKLQLRTKINEIILNNLFGIEFKISRIIVADIIRSLLGNLNNKISFFEFENNISTLELLHYLINDSIFCYFEIIKLYNTFDRSFSLNYSLLFESHTKLWQWSNCFNVYLVLESVLRMIIIDKKEIPDIILYVNDVYKHAEIENKFLEFFIIELKNSDYVKKLEKNPEYMPNLSEDLKKLIEPDNIHFISTVYQCEKAINAFYAMKYTHRQGESYKNLIENMYYLNDDFNDELLHFSVALERYKLNCKFDEKDIEILKERTKPSGIYKPTNYIKEFDFL